MQVPEQVPESGGHAGRHLLVGALVAASVPGMLVVHVHRGDTLSAIAARHHTTVSALVALNHLPGNGDLILAGQVLRVPAGRTASATSTSGSSATGSYRVRAGDTISAIAAASGTTSLWMREHNRLGRRAVIYIGQRLVVPTPARHAASTGATFAGRTYPAATVAAARRHRLALAAAPAPSRRGVRQLVVAAAHRYSVDPALALALAAQESGFSQRAVSPADAIGALQVLPATGDFVSRYVVHRPLNLLHARDNVTAGVALLGQLLRAAPREQAVAGYYQGLGSVRKNGMYRDTKAYVRNILALRARYTGAAYQ